MIATGSLKVMLCLTWPDQFDYLLCYCYKRSGNALSSFFAVFHFDSGRRKESFYCCHGEAINGLNYPWLPKCEVLWHPTTHAPSETT